MLLERARAHEARTDYAARRGRRPGGADGARRHPRTPPGDAQPAPPRRRHHRWRGGARWTRWSPTTRPGWVSPPSSATPWRRPVPDPDRGARVHAGSGSRRRSTWRRPGSREARATRSPEAVARSLDGLKTVHAYGGDADRPRDPCSTSCCRCSDGCDSPGSSSGRCSSRRWSGRCRGTGPRRAAGSTDALELNRETGYDAYAGFFRAQRAWLARLAGDLDTALDDGRRPSPTPRPPTTRGGTPRRSAVHASTLLELGRRDEAAELCVAGLGGPGCRGGRGLPAALPRPARRGHGREARRGRCSPGRRRGAARAGLGVGRRRLRRRSRPRGGPPASASAPPRRSHRCSP